MREEIVKLMNEYAKLWHEACVNWEAEYMGVNQQADKTPGREG